MKVLFRPKKGPGNGYPLAVGNILSHDLRRAFAQLGNCVRCFERQAGQHTWAEKQHEGIMRTEIVQKAITGGWVLEDMDEAVGVG